MPEWASLALATAGAIILLLVSIVAWMYQEDRKGLSTRMQDGFNEVKQMFVAQAARFDKIDQRQAKLEKDCVPREEFNRLKVEVAHHSTEIAVIKTTCFSIHNWEKNA